MILKPAHFVPPTKKVDEMFDYFQSHNTRVAIILGEYGEVFGIVTMKDVLTFIFGEISGKMAGQEYYKEDDENSYVVPGDMRLADFYNLTNFDIEDPVMATIGGVAFRLFDRLPEPGDQVTNDGYRFVVKQRKGLRISQLQVQKMSSSEQRTIEGEGRDESSGGDQQGDPVDRLAQPEVASDKVSEEIRRSGEE
jgi:CBS domain containing-hemolysin-like protein